MVTEKLLGPLQYIPAWFQTDIAVWKEDIAVYNEGPVVTFDEAVTKLEYDDDE